ncbi:unnamed protein product, partial [marine sediment metagenome]
NRPSPKQTFETKGIYSWEIYEIYFFYSISFTFHWNCNLYNV